MFQTKSINNVLDGITMDDKSKVTQTLLYMFLCKNLYFSRNFLIVRIEVTSEKYMIYFYFVLLYQEI